jgi:hypothetical protein
VIKHIVCFKFKDDARPEDRQATLDALNGLAPQIPWVRNWSLGKNFSPRDQTFEYALECDFLDASELERYLDHPEHVRVAREYLGPFWARRAIVDYEFDESGSDSTPAAPGR